MGSKKKREKAAKRKLDEGSQKIEVSVPKKKFEQEQQNPSCSNNENAVILPTRQAIAERLCVAIRQKEFTIVQGPIGCGKSYLGVYIADKLQLKLRTMQMGDQIDSKSVYGQYQCTEVVGQFQWKPSSFTKWLMEPSLIFLEDIDLANADVISIFIEIAKTRRIIMPSGEAISFHDKARLLATTSGKGKPNSLLQGVPSKIRLEPLTNQELKRLVSQSYPRCAHLAKTLISIFRTVEAVPATGNSRCLTSSDFLRVCARLERMAELSSNIDIFSELIDCWCLSELPDRAQLLCEKVAAQLTITPDQIAFHLGLRQPSFTHDDYQCTIGRCRLQRSPSLNVVQHHKLGHTRDVIQLMERIAVCVKENESILLVGETGVGKTSVVQALASSLNVTLKVVNLSPTSDSDELLEGYKPTTIGNILQPFTKFYHDVFTSNLDASQNKKFLDSLEACLNTGRYRDYLSLAEKTSLKVMLGNKSNDPRWAEVVVRARKIREGIEKNAVPFAVTKGAVLEAVEQGYWLLVDEINLAPPECLDAIVHAISSHAHPNFRLFACMNPATDAGKRRLPTSVRTRFTEFYVAEMTDPHQLALVVNAYLPSMKVGSVENIVKFYLQAKKDFPGSYSLRTFCRALLFAADNMFGSEERSIYEAISMAFLTNLDSEDKMKMNLKIRQTFRVATNVPIPIPTPENDNQLFVKIEGYWIECGSLLPKTDDNYVLTKTVRDNLAEIARIVSSGRFPVLLEGETSAGKTAIVTYLGKATGNEVIRINNHEHTDIQEYMGSYVAGEEGRLFFAEGALVKAVKNGSWVILDELNLAPTDVIESLNRLLDDNRELFIPELNKAIKAHPKFRLFATQNPAGTYSGRKRLSRALLSRFVVLKFQHLPMDELAQMVCTRCKIHSSAAEKMIAVLMDLRSKRSLSGLFSARDGLMTLRDVFRWAKRLANDELSEDWLQVLVDHGYFLLAGRCRTKKDELTVIETLEKILKRQVNTDFLFAENSVYFPKNISLLKIVLTYGMRSMLVLTEQAWKHNEAVLMVGETGGGKTSMAETMGRGKLLTINCHERTETADLLGRLRPRDAGGFEWSDGVVISAMKAGVPLLVDEISLAEDSVLERLNPLFEEDRSLLLSDAGVEVHSVEAQDGYQMIATMNPGGDYGKKELSKALRNRFTEIWSSSEYKEHELISIFDNRLNNINEAKNLQRPTSAGKAVVLWISEFFDKYSHVFRHAPSVRDIVACADLYGSMLSYKLSELNAVKEAISAVFLDALESLPTRMVIEVEEILADADRMLTRFLKPTDHDILPSKCVEIFPNRITIGWISMSYGTLPPIRPKAFSLKAPTCISNFYRISRGLLINKPILLEGPPGCGKSSTVMALAQLTGNPITRLNLSDQTDLSDLFGSDVPVVMEDGSISFRWEDGPVLRAIKRGEWVLLDEMNLASQSVLEGLNACFDHRRILYIAELNKNFEIPADSHCRFFACQNPRVQGGNRRALPKSFVNRFTTIWVDDLTKEDIVYILQEVDEHKILTHMQIHAMVEITYKLSHDHHLHGGPFTFNLRDLLRWLQLYTKTKNMSGAFFLLFVSRMRTEEDRVKLCEMYQELFEEPCVDPPATVFADSNKAFFGPISLPRKKSNYSTDNILFTSQTSLLIKLANCVKMHWLSLIVGPRGFGKKSTIENLAQICGVKLERISLTTETDAQELIGSYEQIIDETVFDKAKAAITEILLSKVSDPIMKSLRFAENLMELEIATEHALAQIANSNLIENCREALYRAAKADMRFSWIDSVFVKAFVEGHWLIIENVNMCSAAVLDRLNSCLESDGKLVISERQSSFEPLEPHENFRVFLTMDPKDGEISRAMRNRSVEIHIDNSWSTDIDDSTTLASLAEKQIPKQISEALIHYPIETQLQFSILLREMKVEEACRMLNIQFNAKIEDGRPINISPKLKELDSERYLEWILNLWNFDCGDILDRLLLYTLSSSRNGLIHSSFFKILGEVGKRFNAKLSPILDNLPPSSIPIDGRFIGLREYDEKTFIYFQRFVNLSVSEWALLSIENCPLDIGSAENLSRTMTKYEMSTSSKSFKNLQLIAGLSDAIVNTLKNGTINGEESYTYNFCLSLFLLIKAVRTILADRSGYAPIYLAWNYLVEYGNLEIDSLLTKVMKLMKLGWTSDDHQQFVNKYMSLYENNRMVDAFENIEDCQRLQEQFSNQEHLMDIDNPTIAPSPIVNSLEFIRRTELILSYLQNLRIEEDNGIFSSQKPLIMMKWTNKNYERFWKILAVLNSSIDDSTLKILSLPSMGSFAFVYGSFWKSLNYDVNMSSLFIRDLQNLSLKTFTDKMWRLSANGSLVDDCLNREVDAVSSQLTDWATMETSGWQSRIEIALQIMDKAIPPRDTIDPVIYEEEKVRYLSLKLEIVDRQLSILGQWRKGIAKQSSDCDLNSTHPIIMTLYQTRTRLLEELDDCITKDSPVYRQEAYLYSSMCTEIRSFYSVILEVAKKLLSVQPKNLDKIEEIQLIHAQLNSFVISADSFKQNILAKFTSFIDVSAPFLLAVDVLLSAIYDVCSQLEIVGKFLELRTAYAFPPTYQLKNTSEGAVSDELLTWSCRDGSPMPLRLKAAVVRRRIRDYVDPLVDLEWARREWKKWYERNVAKSAEKDYIYRDKSEEEKEELEILEFFADCSQENEILPPDDVYLLLNRESGNKTRLREIKESEMRYSMALTWIRYLLTTLQLLKPEYRNSSIANDLLLTRFVSECEQDISDSVFDVYRAASISEFKKAGKLLEALVERTKEVLERWPEIVTLKLILDCITVFQNSSITTSHVKMSVLLENTIEQCEEWEKLADRANSLREPLAPLRQLLVDWKKAEIRSWSHLLARTEEDAFVSAQLVAFPLFDALFKATDTTALANIVAMSADWLHNGTLLDFPSRIQTIKNLAEWSRMLKREILANKLESLTAHFEQYASLVEKNFLEHRNVAVQSLHDYIKIVKYNDLNLWNIKAHAHKAHAHIFKIIKKFKANTITEASIHFDKLINIDKWKNIQSLAMEFHMENVRSDFKWVKKAEEFSRSIKYRVENICDISVVEDLIDHAEGSYTNLCENINYDQYENDEAKEKAQGYARNYRQRDIALIIKEAQTIGLNARRAITLNQETLTQKSITDVTVNTEREHLIRACAGGRNICIKKAHNANSQLGVATRKHFSGMIEYGMSWLLKIQSRLVRSAKNISKFKNSVIALRNVQNNIENSYYIDHEQLKNGISLAEGYVLELCGLIENIKYRIDLAPDSADGLDDPTSSHLHPLSLMHVQHPDFDELQKSTTHALELSRCLKRLILSQKHSITMGIFDGTSITVTTKQVETEAAELQKTFDQLRKWFSSEVSQLENLQKRIHDSFKVNFIDTSMKEINTERILLLVQYLYKNIVSKEEWDDQKAIDKFELISEFLESPDVTKVNIFLDELLGNCAVGILPSNLLQIIPLVQLIADLFDKLFATTSRVLQSVAVLHYRLVAVTIQLFENGYVNTIPKEGKQESGDGKTDEAGEGGGMGEGKSGGDAKDVTDEMEETGQIEGLQDEEQEPPSGQAGDNEKPIDMDEDFAEDIQDIDKNEKGVDEGDEDDEDEEPEPEDQIGDVDDADDTQLDPKLWDEDDKEEDQKDLDQNDTGADNKTDQMAAKEDDPLAAQQQEQHEENPSTENEEDKNDEDVENVENVDERDRDDEHQEKSEPEITDDKIDDNNEDENDEIDMDNQMELDEADKEDEELMEGSVDEEGGEEENPQEEINENPGEDDNEHQDDNAEAIEQGTGGERRDLEANKNEGGQNEDKEEEEEKTEQDGKGDSKSDETGDKGQGAEAKEKEDKENAEENDESAEKAPKDRQIATEDDEAIEAEEGEGEENESGQMMEDSATAEKQMHGAGSMEEAKQSKREEHNDENLPRKRKPLPGGEKAMDVPMEDELETEEEGQAAIHLAPEDMFQLAEDLTNDLILGGQASDEHEPNREVTEYRTKITSRAEAEKMWTEISRSVNILSSELAENLRLILEPQRASKMQGDYRSGKRLNMRRLIPYIASDYRKDRIWMRRTKRSQRDYQVLIAVDDSASMNENGIHQVTCESVCAIDDALRKCDAGTVSVISFGSQVKTICAFGDQIIPGPEFIEKLTFDQSSTDLLSLLNKSRSLLNDARTSTSEQLLIIISDGRGALSQGAEKVKQAVASLQSITVLFVILDTGSKSISDLSVASFKGGSVVLTPYLSLFPFPFYAVVKTIRQLPSVLAESIRQWFELSVQSF